MQTSLYSTKGHRPYQEDSAGIRRDLMATWSTKELVQAIVADGVGGNAGGAEASMDVCQALPRRVVEILQTHDGELTHEVVANAGKQAAVGMNRDVRERIQSQAGLERAATTLVDGVIWCGIAFFTTIGDSAAWLIRGRSQEVEPINRLHKLVDDAVIRGEIAAEEAADHPQRNVVTSVVGISGAPRFEQHARDLEAGDVVVLMTDGVSECVTHQQAARAVKRAIRRNAFSDVATDLVNAALDAGSRDNCTAIALLVEPSDIPAERPVPAETLAIGLETQLQKNLANKEYRDEA